MSARKRESMLSDRASDDARGESNNGGADTGGKSVRSRNPFAFDLTSPSRTETARGRDEGAERRDRIAAERDEAARARDRIADALDAEIAQFEVTTIRNGGRPIGIDIVLRAAGDRKRAAASRARAAAQRESAARDRELAAEDRRQAAADRRAAAEELAPEGGSSRREGRSFLASDLAPSSRMPMTRRLAGDVERERIEQDLHDGIQQHLTALRIRVCLAAEEFGARGETEASAVLEGFGDDVEHVIDEVRDLAHGIYPALLSSGGLSAALVSAGLRGAPQVSVQASGLRRCRPEVEIAVYFSCLAALDNAAKHARAAPVSVCLSDTGRALRFTVCDSGPGFDPNRTPTGSGIANMRDRIAAVGGTLTIDSAPGHGTRVQGSVPDPWLDATP
jgi:signal transduction histidine kinase